MTDEEILKSYGLVFNNKVFDHGNGREVFKEVSSNNGSLYRFLNDWNDVSEIDEDLLPIINHVLNNPSAEETADSDTEWVEINNRTPKFGTMETPMMRLSRIV
jgi:hypothetical protein